MLFINHTGAAIGSDFDFCDLENVFGCALNPQDHCEGAGNPSLLGADITIRADIHIDTTARRIQLLVPGYMIEKVLRNIK